MHGLPVMVTVVVESKAPAGNSISIFPSVVATVPPDVPTEPLPVLVPVGVAVGVGAVVGVAVGAVVGVAVGAAVGVAVGAGVGVAGVVPIPNSTAGEFCVFVPSVACPVTS